MISTMLLSPGSHQRLGLLLAQITSMVFRPIRKGRAVHARVTRNESLKTGADPKIRTLISLLR